MKKLLYIFFLLITSTIVSQDVSSLMQKAAQNNPVQELEKMSDQELLSYWEQAQEQGYTLNQLKTLARAQGASESDLAKFEKRINGLSGSTKSVAPVTIEDSLSSIFGITKDSEDEFDSDLEGESYTLPIFGMDFFKSKPDSSSPNSSPQLNIATPSTYQLGPGDEISISIWGGAENEYNTIINTNGFIKLERIPPIYLSGYSIFSAKKRIGNALSKIYAGINSTSESYQKVYFDIALKNTRSIVLNIVGNVMTPGTYTLSSMTSPLNALYAAGGPNENGSFRNVKILRNGKTFKTIDLYDYFAKGVYPTLSLRDQDVILVPSYSKRVFINGEFKQEGIFELKEKETLEDLLVFSGGFSSFAYKNKLFVESISGVFKQIKTFDKTDFDKSFLNDGDVITANPVSDKFLNKVSIEGAVYLPGDYQIESVKTIKGLISAASGLKENAQNSRAFLIRKKNGIMQEMISIDLNNVLNKEKDISLSNGDKLIISNKEDLKEESSVFIKGEVNEPGKYPFYQGMTVADLVLSASGFKNSANSKQIDLYKLTYDPTGKSPIELKQASLNIDFSVNNETNNLTLDNDDMVIVRSKEGFKQKKDYVTLSGLVKRPGEYGVIDDSYSLYDLLADAGGLLPNASLNGLKIRRLNSFKEESEEIFNSLDSLNIEKAEIKEFIEFGVDAKKLFETKGEDPRYNVILKNEDEVSVAKIENTIEITGQVQQPTVINYEKRLTVGQAIINAGGVNDLAKKGGTFVVYQNGRVKSNRKYFLIFNSMPKLEPGCKIIVPRKVENPNKTSLGEIIGLTSTLASLAILIRSL